MPKTKTKTTSSSASAAEPFADLEIDRYPDRLWTVTKAGEICMAVATPPAHQDESFGPYWEVSKCGDHGGPPANKVRAMIYVVDSLIYCVCVLCVRIVVPVYVGCIMT